MFYFSFDGKVQGNDGGDWDRRDGEYTFYLDFGRIVQS